MQEIQSLGQEDPLEKEMATDSSILAWRIPWTEEPGGSIGSMGSQRVGHDLATRSYLLFAQEVKDLCHQVEVNTKFTCRASSNRNSVMYHASFILLIQMLCCG